MTDAFTLHNHQCKKRDEQGFFYTQRPRNVMIS